MFLAVPPLYSIRKGKTLEYFYSDEELQYALKDRKPDEKFDIQRYKGLGEMNPNQLWETTMSPDSRRIKRIEIDDIEKSDDVFEMLMGEEVAPRRRFIETHARNVQNLDV